jgi:hypothetical protein
MAQRYIAMVMHHGMTGRVPITRLMIRVAAINMTIMLNHQGDIGTPMRRGGHFRTAQ